MTARRRRAAGAVALLVAVPLVAATLTIVASLVPDRLILDALVDGVNDKEILNVPQVGISGQGLDVFSDCIALTMGLGDSDGGTATAWLRSPTLGSCTGAIPSIERFRDGAGLSGGYEYFRYWHGYTTVSRPLLAVVGVSGVRIVLFWLHLGVLAMFARRLWRCHGPLVPLALLGPFVLTSDTIELARSLPHGLAAIIGVAGALAVHTVSGRSSEPGSTRDGELAVAATAFVAGSAYVFVDLLTTPPGAWALTIIAAMLAAVGGRGAFEVVRRGALVGAAWIGGWAWTWVAKWGLAAAILGLDRVRSDIGDAVDDRIAGERDYIELAPLNAIEANVREWWQHPLTPVVVLVVVIAAAVRLSRASHRHHVAARLALAAPAAIPFLWFELLRNHSLVHVGFVHRSLGVSAGVVALALLIPSDRLHREFGATNGPDVAQPSDSAPG